ncbi:hypothetical protein F8388_014134 [Cannabis sativa]|uniref:MADS-box domain-containing protein n=1 Tax=Cannabis sativa TaxID=3483 RepID=A0A7J6GGR2_CANSA|nr:hypothetical protein G4B88_006649 [Cannabis sativa]KAF4383634.1 hypothetical protein F8388_014134 [Cannabis sativa]
MEMINNINNSNNNIIPPIRRVCRGRQKVPMRRIENESNLQVTFSKRRYGIFKKASELCTLCGVELAIIVFSPGNNVFSFGHPNVRLIIDRYMNPENYSRMTAQANLSGTFQLIEAHRNADIRVMNQHLNLLTDQWDVVRKQNFELKQDYNRHWWEFPIESFYDMSRLEQLKLAMEMLRGDTTKLADWILIQSTPTRANSLLLPPPFNNMNKGGLLQLPSFASLFPNQEARPHNNNNNNDDDEEIGFVGGMPIGSTCTDIPQLQQAITSDSNRMSNMPQMQLEITSSDGTVNNHEDLNLQSLMQDLTSSDSFVNHANQPPPHTQVNASDHSTLSHVNQQLFSPVMQNNMQASTNYNNKMSTMPHMMEPKSTFPAQAGSVNNNFNISVLPHMMQQPNNSSTSSTFNNHFNMSPMPNSSASATVSNHFNISPMPPHHHHTMQPNTTTNSSTPGASADKHFNMTTMPSHGHHMQQPNTTTSASAINVNHQLQLPMLHETLSPSSQLLLQQPNDSQETDQLFDYNVGYDHEFF